MHSTFLALSVKRDREEEKGREAKRERRAEKKRRKEEGRETREGWEGGTCILTMGTCLYLFDYDNKVFSHLSLRLLKLKNNKKHKMILIM